MASTRLQLFTAHRWVLDHRRDDPIWDRRYPNALTALDGYWSPKLELAHSLIGEAFGNGRKVLLFANYNRVAPLIEDLPLDFQHHYFGTLNGNTPQEIRQQIVDEFSDWPRPGVLVLNPKVAAAGLNITAATVVIHFTQSWNPATQMQASARAHRRGQAHPVSVFRLFYQNTVEQVMVERSQRRRELGEDLLPNHETEKTDLARLLSITPSESKK